MARRRATACMPLNGRTRGGRDRVARHIEIKEERHAFKQDAACQWLHGARCSREADICRNADIVGRKSHVLNLNFNKLRCVSSHRRVAKGPGVDRHRWGIMKSDELSSFFLFVGRSVRTQAARSDAGWARAAKPARRKQLRADGLPAICRSNALFPRHAFEHRLPRAQGSSFLPVTVGGAMRPIWSRRLGARGYRLVERTRGNLRAVRRAPCEEGALPRQTTWRSR
jgi:hypothetical protein